MNKRSNFLIALLLVVITVPARAGDYWMAAGEPGVVTNSDCGTVTAVVGEPRIRRAFMAAQNRGLVAVSADRLHAGDEVETPAGGRLEWNCGSNRVLVLGSASRVKLDGVLSFVGPGGVRVNRLDLRFLQGEIRVQTRLNQERPEAVLITLENNEILITRGDVAIYNTDTWHCVALGGQALVRTKRGTTTGAPFAVTGTATMSGRGEERLEDSVLAGVRERLPFTFESTAAALPPLPALSGEFEALGP